MAIQLRYGVYADFDPTKMVPAEVGIVTSGDPNTDDGKAAYVAFSAGNAKRLATVEDIATDLQEATDDAVGQATARAEAAAESVEASAAQIATNTADISDLKADLSHIISGLTERQKQAFLNAFNHVAWDEDDPTGQTYIDALHASFYGVNVDSITVTFAQGDNPIFDSDSLDALRPLLTVVAHYSNGSSGVVTDYELSGNLNSATSRITVAYEDATATFNVSVTMPTFDYKASRDGLLSAKSGIIIDTNSASSFSERVTSSGNLRLEGTNENDSTYFQFKIGDNPTTGKWRLRTKVMFYSLSSVKTGGFRPRISNGASGAQIATKSVNGGATIFFYEGASYHSVATGLTIGAAEQWYDVELFIDSSEPVQRLTIDGESIYESATLATNVKNNSVFIVGKCLIFIDTIKLYNA